MRRDSRTVCEPAGRVSSEIDYRFHDARTCPRRILLQSIPLWNSVLHTQLNILRAFKMVWKLKYRASESIIDRQCSFPIGAELGGGVQVYEVHRRLDWPPSSRSIYLKLNEDAYDLRRLALLQPRLFITVQLHLVTGRRVLINEPLCHRNSNSGEGVSPPSSFVLHRGTSPNYLYTSSTQLLELFLFTTVIRNSTRWYPQCFSICFSPR